MEHIFTIAALWLGLAIVSAIIAYHLRISIALVEICVGVIVGFVADSFGKIDILGSHEEWLRFLASSGAILLTFLAGAELEPDVIRRKLKEVIVIGLIGFLLLSWAVPLSLIIYWTGISRPVCFVESLYLRPRWRWFMR